MFNGIQKFLLLGIFMITGLLMITRLFMLSFAEYSTSTSSSHQHPSLSSKCLCFSTVYT